jgi:signal transduction histidine kinase
LLAIWGLILAWQAAEHERVRTAARAALVNRAKDISNTVVLVTRSQRRFGGVINQERLESALNELVGQGELISLALLNAAGEVVASAGAPIDPERREAARTGQHWGREAVTLANLVDLGTNFLYELGGANPTIVLPRREHSGGPETNRPPFAPGASPDFAPGSNPSESRPPPQRPWSGRNPRDGRPAFGRPFWMGEAEYRALMEKQGVHSFVVVMSTLPLRSVSRQDLWMRAIIVLLATVSVAGSGFAWSTLLQSSDLQIRLVRASELNLRLKEMNLAAAGLAHETRNPLNIIRGLAQMISKQPEAPPEIRQKSRAILDEADRVTGQLNEFINYSRPREVRHTAVALESAIDEVIRALGSDIDDQAIVVRRVVEAPRIEADEQLLRQVLFNLILNAIQAVERQGQIEIVAERDGAQEARLEVRDNGPGVPAERRTEVFKPYFTTQERGTGLGLAIVQQIVLAHGWEIECLAHEPRGAVFRITHLRLSS